MSPRRVWLRLLVRLAGANDEGQAIQDRLDVMRYRLAVARADAWLNDFDIPDEATTAAKDTFASGATAYQQRIRWVLRGGR